MTAQHVARLLLDAEDDIPDPKEYALETNKPVQLLQAALRDELVDRGWRQIRVQPGEDGWWLLDAGIIDLGHRAYWLAKGARVAPQPTHGVPTLRPRLMHQFNAAMQRAGANVAIADFEYLAPAYTELDLAKTYDDFEDDPGDWRVQIKFSWVPTKDFFSKASKATGYE